MEQRSNTGFFVRPVKRRILAEKTGLLMEFTAGNTVLIIEDEHDVVNLLAPNLRKAGLNKLALIQAGTRQIIMRVKTADQNACPSERGARCN